LLLCCVCYICVYVCYVCMYVCLVCRKANKVVYNVHLFDRLPSLVVCSISSSNFNAVYLNLVTVICLEHSAGGFGGYLIISPTSMLIHSVTL